MNRHGLYISFVMFLSCICDVSFSSDEARSRVLLLPTMNMITAAITSNSASDITKERCANFIQRYNEFESTCRKAIPINEKPKALLLYSGGGYIIFQGYCITTNGLLCITYNTDVPRTTNFKTQYIDIDKSDTQTKQKFVFLNDIIDKNAAGIFSYNGDTSYSRKARGGAVCLFSLRENEESFHTFIIDFLNLVAKDTNTISPIPKALFEVQEICGSILAP